MTGKYTFSIPVGEKNVAVTVLARDYYNGTTHVTVLSESGGYNIPKNVAVAGETLTFTTKVGDIACDVSIQVQNGQFTGTVTVDGKAQSVGGPVAAITPEDDRTGKVNYRYRALILYSSLTGNTEKIALAFKETLEHYCFRVDMMKITSKLNVSRDFSSYDLVCLGSPIIAGSPTKVVSKKMSLGGGDGAPTGDPPSNAPGGPAGGQPIPGGPGMPGMPPQDAGDGTVGSGDNTPMAAAYAGGPPVHGIYQPLGLVFTTYGGGFYGSNEALATLETMKLYLELQNVIVVGKYACCGKETGPAGLVDGDIPNTFGGIKLDPPVYYKDADEKYHAGSFFFHTHMNDKPCDRDIDKARYLMMDLIEDYFLTNDGIRRNAASQYISIS